MPNVSLPEHRTELPDHTLGFTWDAFGRQLSQTGPLGTLTSTFDLAGRRTRLAHPDGFFVDYDYLTTGEVTRIRENGAASGVGVLATYGYDNLGRRTTLTRGNGTVTSYAWDPASRLQTLAQDLAGATHDLTLGFAYNPAAQIVSNTRSNDLFSAAPALGTQTVAHNGLNQASAVNDIATVHDARGNMTNDLAGSYGYSSENLMTSGPAGAALAYDPAMRLFQVAGATTARFAWDGFAMAGEYDGANTLRYRYVHGGATDEPLVQYDGPGTAGRRFLHADERGSIVAHSDSAGATIALNRYDEYGLPASGNAGRLQYTAQAWLAEIGLHYYRARMYNPRLGRFMQTDPIGYTAGMNLYAYVGGDPVNRTDPSGLRTIYVDGRRYIRLDGGSGGGLVGGGRGSSGGTGYNGEPAEPEIVVTGRRVRRPSTAPTGGPFVPLPPICDGLTLDGNTVSIQLEVEFRRGNYWNNTDYGPADPQHARYYTDLANNGVHTNGPVGNYTLDTTFIQREGGFRIFIQDPGVSGEWANSSSIWLTQPSGIAAESIWLGHAIGHALGNQHNTPNRGDLMDANPFLALPSNRRLNPDHLERGLAMCGLQ